MATKLLAGESMVLPTIRKHWIVIASSLFWPTVFALGMLITSFFPAVGVSRAGPFRLNLTSSLMEWLGILSVGLAVIFLLGLIGVEFRGGGAGRSLGCLPALITLIGSVLLGTLLRLVISDAVLEAVVTLGIASTIVGTATWWAWLNWKAGTMTITDQRVILEDGVVQRAAKVIPLDRVQDVSTTQSLLGRFLDYGNVEIDTAGAIPNELFKFARHPDMLRDQVFVLSEQLRRGGG
jgi:membrane protein YdbS with pleckstrin-like domain